MKFKKIEEILKSNAEKTKFNAGFMMNKRRLVSNSYSNIDNDIANFYATVNDEYQRQKYTSMITINTKTNKISNISCDCKHVLSKNNKVQICEHIVAAVLSGIEISKNKKNIKKDEKIESVAYTLNMSIMEGKSNNMEFSFAIKGIEKSEHRKIFNSFKENKKYHRLPGGGYLDIKDNNLEKSLKLIEILGIDDNFSNIKINNNKAIYLENFIKQNEFDFVKGTRYLNSITKKFKNNKDKKFKVSKDLKATLRNYQVEGVEFFDALSSYEFGGILADEMGLGKTVQTIAYLLSQKSKNSIVIAPTALIYNWKNEFEKFAPNLKIGLAHGNVAKRNKIIEKISDYDVILTSYTTFKNDFDKYQNIDFDCCVIDEAQNIKNPDSIITNIIKSINAKVKFALTGTPIENNLLELWSIFDFVMPGYLYNKSKFQSSFINNDKNYNELKNLIKPFMLRRTKSEVIEELPDKIEQKFIVELEKEHKRVYSGYINLVRKKINEISNDNISIFSYLTKLRQLSLAPEIMVKDYKGKNSKLEVVMNIINESNDSKILLFSQFTKVLDVIKQRLEKENIKYSYLDGKTEAKKRIELVDEFNQSSDKKIFLISLKAGGTGLNLTSANIVIHFDPWWNPAVENQASDRAHRIGQKNVVNVIKLIAKDSVEERVSIIQETKKELIEEFIDNSLENSKSLKNLSKEELMDLFID